MLPRMTTRSANCLAAASGGGGTGRRAGKGGGRTGGQSIDQGNGRIDGQGGQVGVQVSKVNDGVDGVPDFSTIIAQQLQNLLPTIVAQVGYKGRGQGNGRNQNGDAINEKILGDVRNVIENNGHRGCTYKEFLACNPKEDNQKVKYTAGSFVGKDVVELRDPHMRVRRYGRYIYGLASRIQGMVVETEPMTFPKVVQTAGTITDEALRNGSIKKNPKKRGNRGEPSNDRNRRDDNKRTRIGNAFATTANPIRREYIEGHVFGINLIPFGSRSFDMIIGMDWLSNHKAEIICHEKVVRIPLPDSKVLRVIEESLEEKMRHPRTAKTKEQKQEEIVVVRDYPEVFPDDLSGLPLNREIKFRIELVPGAIQVEKSPYRLTPSKMEELFGQLKELQEKGFIPPSSSPWGAHVLFVKKKDGLAWYYHRFIENFSKIAKSLTILTQKYNTFDWGEEHERAFQTLKDKLCNAPVLALPDGLEDFVVYCDASDLGLGYVLMQRGKVIACASRQLKIHGKYYTTYDLELGAVVFALNIWRHYLNGTKKLFSDYDYEIRYHPGKANIIADALTQKEACDEYVGLQKGLDEMIECRNDGELYYMDQIWVPLKCDVRTLIMDETYKLKYFVHPGDDKMYYDLRDRYWWSGMKKDIAVYVSKCLICLKVKAEHQRPFGLLQQPKIPKWKWEGIAMDFITKLPRTSSRHDTIWVIVDRLTKSAHFLPMREDYKMDRLARLYLNEIVTRHGVPISIISDCDSQFTSRGSWDVHLPLVEFSYNNSYHSGVICAPFEALYGRKCRSLILWAEKGVVRFGKKGKLAPRFVGPFEVIEKVGLVAYRLDLLEELDGVHDMFHVLNLKKCLADPTLQVSLDEIQVDAKLNFMGEPVEILE
ncbi:putative reverse transcriptase domain-containing protein [Tanacetum coccineum]